MSCIYSSSTNSHLHTILKTTKSISYCMNTESILSCSRPHFIYEHVKSVIHLIAAKRRRANRKTMLRAHPAVTT